MLPLPEAECLLQSTTHEERLLALVILVTQFQKGDAKVRKSDLRAVLGQYGSHQQLGPGGLLGTADIGGYLRQKSEAFDSTCQVGASLGSPDCILATFHFIRRGEFDDTLKIAEMLLGDQKT